MLSLLSLGVWLIPWAAVLLHWQFRKPWRCESCSRRLRPRYAGVTDPAVAQEMRVADAAERLKEAYEAVGALNPMER